MVAVRTILSDCVTFLVLGITATVLKFGNIQPFHRGFYCYDSSIRHPYKSSTIESSLALAVSVLVPLIYISLVEVMIYLNTRASTLRLLGHNWYQQTKIFSLGATTTVLLTSIGKLTIGRLRPHFLTVCRPDMIFSPSVCGSPAEPEYITRFQCSGLEEERILDARLSFPSGHSSAAFYSCVFTVLYLRQRACSKHAASLVFLNQVILLSYAWYCALTRVSDYKHHPTDVLAGGLLGTAMALFMSFLARSEQTVGRREEDQPEVRDKLLAETREL